MSTYEEWCRNMDAQASHIIGVYREEDPLGGRFPEPEQWLRRYFECMKCGDPDRVQVMVDELTEAKYVLGKDLREHLGGAQLDMNGWTGAAADDFRNYLLKLEDAVNVLVECIDSLLLIVRSYQALVLSMRNDALNLIDQTLKAIDNAGADGWKIALAVVGAIAGVVGTVATGGAGAGVAVAVFSSLVSGAAGVANETIDGDSEFTVCLSMAKSSVNVIHGIDVERAKIENALSTLSTFVSGSKLAEVRPDRPVIITAPSFDPGSFGMTDEAQGKHRRPTDKKDLVPEPKRHEDGPYDDGVFGDRYEEQGPA
ncbi:hypothetical protein FKR81_09970 [Lentzea tibetensis]|uniref:Uncharacterized protein n=1 Tax=Lentzea tibetensis TaxID=2591470 RepID=A0A563EYK2_9PSEU|nr:hypothetical protein [Lentzea tibetensis]TWP52622.1 hypothetical protein FKR81_09970 [Lentzea tibetensis]